MSRTQPRTTRRRLTGSSFIVLLFLLVSAWVCAGCDKDEARDAPPPENVNGRELYMRKCAHCHGNQGRGDGPASQAYARVADFTDPALHQRLSDEQIQSIITNGIGQMPPVRGLHPVEVDAVTEFVRQLNDNSVE